MQKMKKTRLIPLLTCAAAGLLGSSAYAAITVQDSYTAGNTVAGTVAGVDSTTATFTISSPTLDLTAGTADKLVIGFSQRRNSDFSVTYGGVSMTQAAYLVSGGTNDGAAGIFYLDNPTLGGDLVITTTNASGGAYIDFNARSLFAFVLSGTAAGGQADFDTSTETSSAFNSVSLTTGSTGGFVIGAAGFNGNGSTTASLITSGSIADTVSAQSRAAAWNDTVSGTYEMSQSTNGSTFAIASFAPVPEPSSVALIGLAGVAFAGRRRRK